MPFPWLAFGIMMALQVGFSAIQYLTRTKQQKGDVFDSKAYHTDGMKNSVEIGAPINVPYGVHKIAPQIRSYLSIAKGDDTTVEALCSCGEGVIGGIRNVQLNNQSFGSLFGYKFHKNGNVKNGYWVTFGEKIQKVYESCKRVEYGLMNVISPGFNATITVNLDYAKQSKYQNASASEPGYLVIYKKTGTDDNAEIVQYTGKANNGGLLQFTGCRVTKSHTLNEYAKQIYKIKKKDSGDVYETIPGFSKTVVNHQEVGTNVTKASPVTVTTVNKVQAVAVTLGFSNGLYKYNDKKGYEKASVTVAFKLWKDGESWSGVETPVTTTRTETSTNDHYIKLEKKKNYGYLVDVNGNYVEGTEDELDQNTDWDIIEQGDILKFTLGSTNYECKVTKPPVKVPTGTYKYENIDGELQYNPICRFKVNFKVQEPEQVDKYNGPKAAKASYTITYEKIEYSNYYETTIEPDKAKLSDYRLTYILPNMERYVPFDYAKYKIQVKKKTDDMTDSEKGINTMTLIEVQEITIDKLSYPHEALLGLKFTSNEKISGTINNISCIVEGRLLKDVQNTGNPDRLSANYFDLFADIITNKRYGRGKELNLSSAELTDFYSKLSPEAAFSDQSITENSKARKRFEVNVNVDFKKPTIDLIQALSICARSNIYWDGVKPLAYVDRATTPTAMFGSANIIPGSYQDQTMDLTENVNRIYPQFLNRNKNYTHDSVARDLRDEGFTINKRRPKSIAIYGITDRWRATKLANYLLRFAKYVQRGCQFQTGGDAITIDMGKTFYYINTKGNCGRILAVASNYITLDRAFTLESGKTYKALVRKDDGTPHTELTVDVGTTGLGSKTVIYFTGSISGVTLATNPIYGIGVDGEYYNTYRCVTKNSKGSSYEITGALYNAETYRLYKNDPSSDLSTNGDTDETENLPTTLDNKSMSPPNIISIKAVEDKNAMGTATIHVTRPISTLWTHAEVYLSEEDDNIEQNVGRTTGEPLRITGLKPDVEYTIRVVSYAGTISNPTPFEAMLALEGTEPGKVSGLAITNNRGNETEMFGRDFKVKCDDMSGIKSDEFVRKEYVDEGLRYLWEVYYSGLPDSVKLGSIKANARKAYYETTRQNEFDFTLEENIEATKQLWKSYENVSNSSYATYYGNPQRKIKIKCWLINAWGKMSPAAAEIELENPAPDMKDSAGVVITPTLRKIKSGLRVEWTHPWKEYDVTHFIVKLATNSGFTTGVKRVKVTSLVMVDSSDDDVTDATYTKEVDGLDPETTYYVKVIPYDPFGKGTESSTVSKKPGLTHDDDEQDKARPSRYDYTKLTITADTEINDDGKTVTNLIVKGEEAAETDADGYILEVRMVKDTAASTPPTGAEIDAGVTGGGKKCDGNTYQIGIDGEAGSGSTDTNYWKKKIHDVKNNWQVFGRVRTQNTSGQKGPWSSASPGAWVSFVTTKDNNAADTTAPALSSVSVGVTSSGAVLEITITNSAPPRDIAGYQVAVKTTAFTSDGDRLSNVWKSIPATADSATVKTSYTGIAGTSYYISVNAYDKSGNVSSDWKDYASNPIELIGISHNNLSEAYAKFKYEGSLTATDADTVKWSGSAQDTAKLYRKLNGAEKDFNITGGTTGGMTAVRFIVWDPEASKTAFQVYSQATLDGKDNTCVIAKVEPVSSGKANVSRRIGTDAYSVSAFEGGFNRLSAITADLGEVTAGTLTGTTTQTATSGARIVLSTDFKVYDASIPSILRISLDTTDGLQIRDSDGTVRAKLGMDGGGWFGTQSNFSWTSGGSVSLNGATITDSSINGGDKIADLTVTSSKIASMAIDKLTTGTITSQSITLTGDGCVIKAGQSGYDAGTGFWLGLAGATPKFSIGNSTGSKLTWDGSTFTVQGKLIANTASVIDGSYVNIGVIPVAQIPDISVSKLTSGSISGITITGGTIQTASSGQKIVLNEANSNEIRVYSSTALICTLGVTTGDLIIGDYGHATYAGKPLRLQNSSSLMTIDITNNGSGSGIDVDSNSGAAIDAASTSGYACKLTGNSTKAPLRIVGQSSVPSSPSEGDVYYDTNVHKLHYYNGTGWIYLP